MLNVVKAVSRTVSNAIVVCLCVVAVMNVVALAFFAFLAGVFINIREWISYKFESSRRSLSATNDQVKSSHGWRSTVDGIRIKQWCRKCRPDWLLPTYFTLKRHQRWLLWNNRGFLSLSSFREEQRMRLSACPRFFPLSQHVIYCLKCVCERGKHVEINQSCRRVLILELIIRKRQQKPEPRPSQLTCIHSFRSTSTWRSQRPPKNLWANKQRRRL